MRKCGCHSHNGFLTVEGQRALGDQPALELSDEGLTPAEDSVTLDMVGSVSGLELERDIHASDDLIDQQYRRFLNGS